MAILSVERITRSGLEPTENAADVGGDSFVTTGVEFVLLQNESEVHTRVVTFVTQTTVDGLDVDDLVIEVPPGEKRFVGPFPSEIYADSNSRVQMTYDWDGSGEGGSGSGSGAADLLVSVLKKD